MTEISEAAKAKYESITGYKYAVGDLDKDAVAEHFAHFIQEVSDAVGGYIDNRDGKHPLAPFILPEPVDPLLEELPALFQAAKERLSQGEGYTRADIITKGGHEMWEARVALDALKRGIELGKAGQS